MTASDESRDERGSHSLSAGALAQLERDNARRKKRPERAARDHRGTYHAADRTPIATPEKTRKQNRGKKRRVVSGAIMEEGRARTGMRGGQMMSEDSYDKEDYYRQPKPKKSKKKLCGYTSRADATTC